MFLLCKTNSVATPGFCCPSFLTLPRQSVPSHAKILSPSKSGLQTGSAEECQQDSLGHDASKLGFSPFRVSLPSSSPKDSLESRCKQTEGQELTGQKLPLDGGQFRRVAARCLIGRGRSWEEDSALPRVT